MWANDGRSQKALTIRPSGSWKWQYRARLSEYRVWVTRDGREIWKFWRVIRDKIPAGNIRGGSGSKTVSSPHNKSV